MDSSQNKNKKMTITVMTTTITLIFLAGSLVTVPTANNQKANAEPSLTHNLGCRSDGLGAQIDLIGDGYPPNAPLRFQSEVNGEVTGDFNAFITTDSNGHFEQSFSAGLEPRTLTYTYYVDLNGNSRLDSEDISASTTVVITGNECDVEEPIPPLTEQFRNEGQCIKYARENPDSGITKRACQEAFVD